MTSVLHDRKFAAWRSFLQAHAAVLKRLEASLWEKAEMPLTWYDILAHLYEAPEGKLRMQVLAESILLSRSGLTRLLDRLVAAGLVVREPCPEDRRGSYAVITSKGRDAFRRAAPVHLRDVDAHFLQHLSETDADTLQCILVKILHSEEPAAS